ncbi:MAG: hypothetical protein WCI55_15885 [Armatimonadota bacterium]
MIKPGFNYFTLIAISLLISSDCLAIERFLIAGKNGWSSLTEPIPGSKGEVGDEEGRPYLRVFKGDIVTFIAGEGSERVLFEDGTAHSWEVVNGTGKLEEITEGAILGVFGHGAIMSNAKKPGEVMISIKIKSLEAGASDGILFAALPVDANGITETKPVHLGLLFNDPTCRNPLEVPQTVDALTSAAMFSPYEHAWRIFVDVNQVSEDTGEREWFSWMRTNTLFGRRMSDVPRWGEPPISKFRASPFFDKKRINRIAFDYIVQNNLHHSEGQKKFLDEARLHANGYGPMVKVDFPRGARTMRVDWRSISFEGFFGNFSG